MKTYAIRDTLTKITGHLRQDGTHTTYCNKPVGIPNGDFTGLKGWKMCTPCVKGEARDRAEATVTATAALDEQSANTLPAVICINHGDTCKGESKSRHIFRYLADPTQAPKPLTDWERELLASDTACTPRYTTADENAAAEAIATPSAPAEQPKPATCGARRPGWTTGPATGINRIPCTLDTDHTGDHRNAFGQTWPDCAVEQNTPQAPHPIETYYTLYCNNHGDHYPCSSPARQHDYMHCVVGWEDRASIHAGDVPPWCHSTANEDAPGTRKRPTAADRAAAAEESRQTAELITEAEATAGTWRGQWIGEQTTASAPGLFALDREQGALFA